MRQPNFKFDWFVLDHIIGLTHFHAEVIEEDIMGVMKKGQELTSTIEKDFHILIDNRVVKMPGLLSLEQLKQMVPYINHPSLRWIVVIKPEDLLLDTGSLPIEDDREKHLKNVSSLPEAIGFLIENAPEVKWQNANIDFFPNSEIGDLINSTNRK